jgi:hypothetical protein
MFLRGNEGAIISSEVLELLQAGLVYCVMLEVTNLLPYQCTSCPKAVDSQLLWKPVVQCRGCGIGACTDCFSPSETDWSFLCPPCGISLDIKRKIPVHLKNSKGRKKSSTTPLITSRENAFPETVDEDTLEDLEENPRDSSKGEGDSQDESNFLPLGQGSPPLQSTQAGSTDSTERSFPDLSLDLTRIQGSQGSSSSQSASGAEEVRVEALEDQSTGFIQPPKRVKALQHKQKQAKKTQDDLIPVNKDDELTSCRFFLKGSCKFFFFFREGEARAREMSLQPSQNLQETDGKWNQSGRVQQGEILRYCPSQDVPPVTGV